MQLFLDESGYSGNNLLDDAQPLFSVATIGMPEDECVRLKNAHFSKSKLPELKYSSLARKPFGQGMVLSFLKDVVARPRALRSYVVHKRTALVRKFVDHLVEPTFYALGKNMYAGHRQIDYANVVASAVPMLKGREYFEEMLRLFHSMLASRTPVTVQALRAFLCKRDSSEAVEKLLLPAKLYLSQKDVEDQIARFPPNNLDLSLTVALPMMSLWREDVGEGEPIHLLHDQSSAMARQSEWWEYVTGKDRQRFGNAGESLRFPIGLDTTDFVTSHDWCGIQLTDVVAGAFREAWQQVLTPKTHETYANELVKIFATADPRAVMTMFPEDKPERLSREDGNEILERVGALMGEMVGRAGISSGQS